MSIYLNCPVKSFDLPSAGNETVTNGQTDSVTDSPSVVRLLPLCVLPPQRSQQGGCTDGLQGNMWSSTALFNYLFQVPAILVTTLSVTSYSMVTPQTMSARAMRPPVPVPLPALLRLPVPVLPPIPASLQIPLLLPVLLPLPVPASLPTRLPLEQGSSVDATDEKSLQKLRREILLCDKTRKKHRIQLDNSSRLLQQNNNLRINNNSDRLISNTRNGSKIDGFIISNNKKNIIRKFDRLSSNRRNSSTSNRFISNKEQSSKYSVNSNNSSSRVTEWLYWNNWGLWRELRSTYQCYRDELQLLWSGSSHSIPMRIPT